MTHAFNSKLGKRSKSSWPPFQWIFLISYVYAANFIGFVHLIDIITTFVCEQRVFIR